MLRVSAVRIADCDTTCLAFFFLGLVGGDIVVRMLKVRFAADDIAPIVLLVRDSGDVVARLKMAEGGVLNCRGVLRDRGSETSSSSDSAGL